MRFSSEQLMNTLLWKKELLLLWIVCSQYIYSAFENFGDQYNLQSNISYLLGDIIYIDINHQIRGVMTNNILLF